MIYDPESNIMSLELTKDPIANAKEFGNFIIHFSKTGKPVLIEILDASKLVGQFDKVKDKGRLKRIQPVPEA